MSQPSPKICILGGGFGGLYTALRLGQLPWESPHTPDITLIDRQDRFLFAPFLYELLTEEMQTWEIAPPFVELLAETGVKFHQGTVTDIDPSQQQVQLADGQAFSYDYLVIAMGGETPVPKIPGVKDHAIGFRTLEDAYAVKQKLQTLEAADLEKIRVAIVGGGYSGVELAAKLGDRLGEKGRIRIIERGETILGTSPEFNRVTAQETLSEKGVWLDLATEVTAITAQDITLNYREQLDTIPVDLVLWTVGTVVSDWIKNLPFAHGDRGFLQTTPDLLVAGQTQVFALGDIAEAKDATGQRLPTTAQVAFQQADYCAWNVWASITGRPLLPFRYQALGEMLSLGTDEAALNGLGIKLSGPAAVLARRLVYLYRFPTWQHQLTVGINWLAQPLLALLKG